MGCRRGQRFRDSGLNLEVESWPFGAQMVIEKLNQRSKRHQFVYEGTESLRAAIVGAGCGDTKAFLTSHFHTRLYAPT